MAISLVGVAGASTSSSVTSYTGPTPPAGTTTNDLVLLLCGMGAATPPAVSSTGYSAVTGADTTDGTGRAAWLHKIAGASESAPTITHATSAFGACVMLVFRGVDTTTPFDTNATSATGGSGSATTVTVPNITTATAQALMIVQGMARVASGQAAWSISANYTEDAEQASSTAGANVTSAGYEYTSGGVAVGTYGGEILTSTVAGRLITIHGALRAAVGDITQTVTDTLRVGDPPYVGGVGFVTDYTVTVTP